MLNIFGKCVVNNWNIFRNNYTFAQFNTKQKQ